jgi:hypothetical protein
MKTIKAWAVVNCRKGSNLDRPWTPPDADTCARYKIMSTRREAEAERWPWERVVRVEIREVTT